MSRLNWVYIGIKKIWRHQPPTANNDHLNHYQPWPMPAEMAPLRPTWDLAPRAAVIAQWGKTPQASGYNFGGSEGVYGPQNTPMLWQCIMQSDFLHINQQDMAVYSYLSTTN